MGPGERFLLGAAGWAWLIPAPPPVCDPLRLRRLLGGLCVSVTRRSLSVQPSHHKDNNKFQITRRCDHSLPLLEEGRFEAVARTEGVRLVPRHELLHGLQDDA